ncbi:MAG TPA: hypothetical protein VGF22_07530 [Acidimicrobiales bacterium]|jgi:hypothetical protein
MWVLVLVPPLLRSRSEGRPSTSVGSFRQQLATLSRTGPDPRAARALQRSVVSMHAAERRAADRGRGPAAAYYDDYDDHRPYPAARGQAATRAGRVPTRRPAPIGYSVRSGRAEVRRRRQNVLFGLLAAAAVTALAGFGLRVSALIAVHLLIDALLVFYVYLLVQLRRAEEQRAMRYAWSKAA